MPDKTPLELARELVRQPVLTISLEQVCSVAAALIEKMTPVVVENQGEVAGVCGGCVSWVERGDKFCPNCGVPIIWK